MILGIPNVGKSTIINTLAGRPAAKTGNEPAVTRAQQAIKLPDNILLYDTPGFLWPKLSPEACGYRLAVTGAIRSSVLDFEDVALFEAEFLRQAYPELIKTRYGFDELPVDGLAVMDGIAAKRRFFGRGGIPDLHKVSEVLLNEFRAGTLGRVSLETPAMAEQEAEEAARAAAEKAEQEAKRTGGHVLRGHGIEHAPGGANKMGLVVEARIHGQLGHRLAPLPLGQNLVHFQVQ
jgi:ribosome biogenesis GTPase A